MTIVGAMIGAGFASGKEIWAFFARFGWTSVLFVLPLVVLLFFCLLVGLEGFALGGKTHKNMKLLIDFCMFFCHFCFLSAMIAGLRVLCAQMGMPVLFLIVFCAIGVFIAFGMKTIVAVSSFLMPVLIVFLVAVGIVFVASSAPQNVEFGFDKIGKIGINLVLYVCMNILTALPILQRIGGDCKKKKPVAFVATVCISFLFLLILVALLLNTGTNCDMPILGLCIEKNKILGVFCFFVLIAATTTTMFSCGIEVVDKLQKFVKNRYTSTLLGLAFASAVSTLGFGKIVEILYPALGMVGAVMIFILAFLRLRQKTI